jgi:ferritin-like protein
MEELEAVDWYQQRVDVTGDEELKAILAHNRDEEIEHAVMALEWLRRQLDKFDEQLRMYLFTSDPITHIEDAADEGSVQSGSQAGLYRDLGVGNLQR